LRLNNASHSVCQRLLMTRLPSRWLAALAAAVVVPVLGLAQGADLGERCSRSSSRWKDHGELGSYEDRNDDHQPKRGEVERGSVLLRRRRCVAEGPRVQHQADMPGGIMAGWLTQEGRRAHAACAALIHKMSRQTGHAQKVFQSAGRCSDPRAWAPQPPDFRDYLLPGDVLGVEVNMTTTRFSASRWGLYPQTGGRLICSSRRWRRHRLPGADHLRRRSERPVVTRTPTDPSSRKTCISWD
jgi:hypothetical protein